MLEITKALHNHAKQKENLLVISPQSITRLGERYEQEAYLLEAQAVEIGIIPERYSRNLSSISAKALQILLRAQVAQVGLGGLGGSIAEMLARTGVGRIRGADGDIFEASNLNRQAMSTMAGLNKPKSIEAQIRIQAINPSTKLDFSSQFLDEKTLPNFLTGCDVAIDALGGLSTRPALQKAATKANIPLITGALAGWTGYVAVVAPNAPSPTDFMGTDNGAEEKLGCPAPAVNCIASLMVAQVIATLTQSPASLLGKMLIVDLATLTFETVTL